MVLLSCSASARLFGIYLLLLFFFPTLQDIYIYIYYKREYQPLASAQVRQLTSKGSGY